MKTQERPAPATLPVLAADGPHAESSPVRTAAFAWEDWFRQATFAEQAEALALAQRQGYVYAHQLPPVSNRARPHAPPVVGDGLDGLRAMLSGKSDALTALAPRTLEQLDPTLAPAQRHAAERVSAAPDVALLRAKPGQAAAVLAEVVTQAARAGQRVLLLAQQPGQLDQVLVRLQRRDAVLPVRFLDPGESAQQLAPALRAYTLDAQRHLFQTGTLAKAQAGRAEAEERCRRWLGEEPLWSQLAQLAVRHGALENKRQTLQKLFDETPGEVQREAEGVPNSGKTLPSGPFALQIVEQIKEFNQQAGAIDQAAQTLEQQRAELQATLRQLEQELAALAPIVAAEQSGRWWTKAWWQARITSNLGGRVADLTKRQADLQAAVANADGELQQLAERRRLAEIKMTADRGMLVAAETERRRHEWASQLAVIAGEQQPLLEAWQAHIKILDVAHAPPALTPAAVATAQARWIETRDQDEAACLFARHWANFLQESAPQFVAQLPRYASLLAGTIGALTKNADFAAFADGPFDLVILDSADRLLENDLLKLARKGRRWLFVGPASGGNARPCSFDKLWQTLHADPAARLTYRWFKEGERWCCQLRLVAAKDRIYLETERLADFPEIELRILALPKTRPQLAQVVFPAAVPLAQAKILIHRELQEAAVQPAGRSAWLEERDDAWSLHLGGAASGELIAIELEPGVREWVSAQGHTFRLDFAKPNWQYAQVDDWMRRNLNLRDLGRTFELV